MHEHLRIQPIQKIQQNFSQQQNTQYQQKQNTKHHKDHIPENYQTDFHIIMQKKLNQ